LPGRGLCCQGVELFGRCVASSDPAFQLAFADHMAPEMRAGMFDVDKWHAVLAQRRRRTPITAKSEVTFQEHGEGSWYEHKKTKSEANAQEYLKDLRMGSSFDAGHGGTGYGLKRNYDMRGREMPTILSKTLCAIWSGTRVSNPRPSPWQGDALPTELVPPLGI
jgi:hypothetical protein